MSQELPNNIEFIESVTQKGYGYIAPLLPFIAVKSEIGKRIVRNWNAMSKLADNMQKVGKMPCFACLNFDIENNQHTDVCRECITTNESKFQQ